MLHDIHVTAPTERRASIPPEPENVSETLVRALASAGVSHAFGLTGGAIAPFARALENGAIDVVHCRHEAGAAFAALEGYFATGRPGLVFTTTGPGLTNAITGLVAAKWEGGKLVVVSAATPASNRGRFAFQETAEFDAKGLVPGASVDYSVLLDDPAGLPVVIKRLAHGLTRPGPFVAHIQLPLSVQAAEAPRIPSTRVVKEGPITPSTASLEKLARLLDGSPFVLWAGFGSRESAATLLAFAEKTGAPVMCTPRGKGAFPEDHPLYLGVTGFGGHSAIDEYMRQHRPAHIVVLGTRLGEMTSLWDKNMRPRESLVHVDLDPDVFGGAYPDVTTIGVQSDVGTFLEGLLREGGERFRSTAKARERDSFPEAPALREVGPVRPQALMAALQEHVLDQPEPVVLMSEAGNAFAWATHWLRFSKNAKYRVSMGFGSMGHAVGAALGIALVGDQKGVALLGDGAMLMNTEVSTAVHHSAKAVWVVLNDAQYGMIRQGMEANGHKAFATDIPRTDFAKMAEAMGAKGIVVRHEHELASALRQAMLEDGPVVVDVDIDPAELAPTGKRFSSLLDQGDI